VQAFRGGNCGTASGQGGTGLSAVNRQHLDEAHQRQIHGAIHESYEEEKKTPNDPPLDVRNVVPRERQTLIFDTYTGLKPGEAFILINDHDPRPLYYQFRGGTYGSVFAGLPRTGTGGLAGADRTGRLTSERHRVA
jgi:hypothetical protein